MAKRALKTTIPDDSIVADVVTQLDHPIEYVRRVLEKLERCRRAHGDAQVRIGVRGRAECPNYLIEYIARGQEIARKIRFRGRSLQRQHASRACPQAHRGYQELVPRRDERHRRLRPDRPAAQAERPRGEPTRTDDGHKVHRQGPAKGSPGCAAKAPAEQVARGRRSRARTKRLMAPTCSMTRPRRRASASPK